MVLRNSSQTSARVVPPKCVVTRQSRVVPSSSSITVVFNGPTTRPALAPVRLAVAAFGSGAIPN